MILCMVAKDYIKSVRKGLRLSQKSFAELFSKSRDTIANYECGRVNPPQAFLDEVQALDRKTRKIQDALESLKTKLPENRAGA